MDAKCIEGERKYKNTHPLSSMQFFNHMEELHCFNPW
jgi:hypothetical protein